MRSAVTSGISTNFLELSRSRGQVAHVLLTRSPLGHPPEGGASLDLHVLSTPPAFVLSQDQTLRECLYDNRPKPGCRHLESHRPATVSITGSYELVLILCRSRRRIHSLDVPKESFTPGKPDADESYMALTFGTLLSSQGADAHRHDRVRTIGGNQSYFTRSVPHGQTRPALPGLPLGRGGPEDLLPRAWGNVRPAPLPGSPLGSPGRAAPSRGQGEH